MREALSRVNAECVGKWEHSVLMPIIEIILSIKISILQIGTVFAAALLAIDSVFFKKLSYKSKKEMT
jgi:hypothetical protein